MQMLWPRAVRVTTFCYKCKTGPVPSRMLCLCKCQASNKAKVPPTLLGRRRVREGRGSKELSAQGAHSRWRGKVPGLLCALGQVILSELQFPCLLENKEVKVMPLKIPSDP